MFHRASGFCNDSYLHSPYETPNKAFYCLYLHPSLNYLINIAQQMYKIGKLSFLSITALDRRNSQFCMSKVILFKSVEFNSCFHCKISFNLSRNNPRKVNIRGTKKTSMNDENIIYITYTYTYLKAVKRV